MAEAPYYVQVPQWLVDQFRLEDGAEGLMADQVKRFKVGKFPSSYGTVDVQFEAASGQSNWWNTINVFDGQGNLIAQSDAGFDLLGTQALTLDDGTEIQFEVIVEEASPRQWSPRSELGRQEEIIKVFIPAERLKSKKGDYVWFEVGRFLTRTFGAVDVVLAVNFPEKTYEVLAFMGGEEIGKSATGKKLLGHHELTLRDWTKIEFDVVKSEPPPGPREWSPRMPKPEMGLHTKSERSRALEAAEKMLAAVTKGDHYDQLVAYGYFMAIRDLAHDEG